MRFFLTSAFCFALFAASHGPAFAQIQPQNHPSDKATLPAGPLVGFNSIAHVIAMELIKAGHKKIVVTDFSGPDKTWTPFSAWLADRLSLAFNEVGYPLKVIDRSEFSAQIEAYNSLSEGRIGTQSEKVCVAISLGADAIIGGTYRPAENGIGVTVDANEVLGFDDQASVAIAPVHPVVGKIPLAKEIDSHVQLPLDAILPENKAAIPGQGGVSYPLCIHCPRPEYSSEANAKKVQGTVILLATITADGRVIQIKVEKGLGYGLDEQAVEAVQAWEFKPAMDADGKSVPVRVSMEVTFRPDRDQLAQPADEITPSPGIILAPKSGAGRSLCSR